MRLNNACLIEMKQTDRFHFQRSPIAKLSLPKTVIGQWASPRVASFSSRGPSSMSPEVLKVVSWFRC